MSYWLQVFLCAVICSFVFFLFVMAVSEIENIRYTHEMMRHFEEENAERRRQAMHDCADMCRWESKKESK